MSVPTLFIAAAVVMATLASVTVFFVTLGRVFPGFREWALAQVSASLGLGLLGLRGHLPDAVTVVLANSLMLAHPLLALHGFCRFHGTSTPRWPSAVAGAAVAGLTWFLWVQPDFSARVAVFGVAAGLLYLETARTSLAPPEARRNRTHWLLGGALTTVGVGAGARGVWHLLARPTGDLAADSLLGALVLAGVTGQILFVCGLVYLNFERANVALAESERRLRLAEGAARTIEHEEALARREARFRALIEQSTDIVAVLDQRRIFRFFSPGGAAELGWREADLLGRAAREFFHPDDGPWLAALFGRMLATPGSTARCTLRFRHRDGGWRLLEAVAHNLLGDPALEGVVVNARDVTERERLRERLGDAQRLESIGRLAGGVAHDFNNLLTAILGGAESVRERVEAGQTVDRDDIDTVLEAAHRAADVTRQLLAFARRQTSAPRVVAVAGLVRDLERLVRRLLPENIALTVADGPEPWLVKADAGQLRQVVLNLAANARDAMPAGGALTLTTENHVLDEASAAALGAPGPGDYVRFSVSDTGTGIAPEVRGHLFEPFFTTKGIGRGTGLGLAAVHGIVTQSRGAIAVQSEPGQGTRIDVYLPRCEAEPPRAIQATAPRGEAKGERVLLVEDEALVRGVAERAMRKAGYDVWVARDAEEALGLALPDQGLQLLVTDVVMPGLDGGELARRLRARQPDLKVIYVSGFARDATALNELLDRGEVLLEKPFIAAVLLERVRAVLDQPSFGGGGH